MEANALQAKDPKLMGYSTEIKKRAVRRLGKLVEEDRKAGKLAKGGQPYQKGTFTGSAGVPVEKATLASQGLDKHLADAARKAAAMTEEEFEASVAKAKKIAVASIEGTQAVVSAARAGHGGAKAAVPCHLIKAGIRCCRRCHRVDVEGPIFSLRRG
jgi:hypothetical protein